MLVERAAERAAIDSLLAGAQAGKSGLLVFEGDPGVGKTALIEYAVERAADLTVLRAVGVEPEAELDFAALLDLCRPVLHLLDALLPEQARTLRGALGLGRGEVPDRFFIGVAVLSLLAAAAERQPVLVVLDDVQWFDSASLDALLFACRRLDADRVAVIVATRDPAAVRGLSAHATVRHVDPLPAPAVAGYLAAVTGSTVAEDVADRLYAATQGNPLALRELARALPPEQLTGTSPLADPLPVSREVERLFRDHLDRLPESAQQSLLVAAVTTSSSLAVIGAALAHLGLDLAVLEPAEDAGLIVLTESALTFRHPLIRAVAHQRALPSQRRAAHRALADALSGVDEERRAWHLAGGSIGLDETAAAALESVGVLARERCGWGAAAVALERSASLTADVSQRIRRTYEAAAAFIEAGKTARAATLLASVPAGEVDPALTARILHLRGRIELMRGSMLAAFATLSEAARLMTPHAPLGAAGVLVDAAEAAFSAFQPESTLATMRRARELVPTDRSVVDFTTEVQLGRALLLTGAAGEAHERLDRALRMFSDDRGLTDGASSALLFAALAAGALGRSAQAADIAGAAAAVARRQGALATVVDLLQIQAHYSRRAGHWRIGYAAAAEARDLADAFQHPWQAVYCLIELAWLDAAQGNEDSCRRHVEASVTLAGERRMRLAMLRAEHALGLLHLGAGQLPEAVGRLRPVVDAVERLGTSYNNLDAVPDYLEALWRMGTPPGAAAGAELLSRCHTGDTDQNRALTRRCLGMLADDDGFDAHFRAAVEAHQTETDPFALARTHLLYGERLRRAQRRREARDELRQALDTFDKLCARPWTERARRELGATGAKVTPRPVSVDLTPQELQIALLVADGRTNREVAATLFISPKTVEFHLSRVYRKLGVRSRTELARLALDDPELAAAPK